MLDLALLVLFCVMAYRIAGAMRRESAILREFRQPRALAFLVLLFPLGPIAVWSVVFHTPYLLAFVAAAVCYLPALLLARRMELALQRAGTDRVRRARDAASQAFGTALIGLVYLAISLLYALAASSIR